MAKRKKKTNQRERTERFMRWYATHPNDSMYPSFDEMRQKIESMLHTAYLEGKKHARQQLKQKEQQ